MVWHPTAEQVERYQRHRGTIAETLLVAQHLDECAECSGTPERASAQGTAAVDRGSRIAHDFRALWWVFILVGSVTGALALLLTY